METYSRVTRFCIICNYVSRIIEPLASRCSKYRFKPLEPQHMKARLQHVCQAENVNASDETLDAVLRVSGGDMRKAITFMQSASQLYAGVLTPENIIEISGVLPEKALDSLLKNLFEPSTTFTTMRGSVQSLLSQGYAMSGILDRLMEAITGEGRLTGGQKGKIVEKLAAVEKRLIDGADEELQMLDVAEFMLRVVQGINVNADRERLPF